MTRNILLAAGLLILIVGAVMFFGNREMSEEAGTPQGKISAETDAAIRARVTEFGSRLQTVSLLSPTASSDLAAAYSAYLTPELLLAWQTNPADALGRSTSSPWPDRIEVVTVSPIGGQQFQVEANVIEITSGDTPMEPAAVYPITLVVQERGGSYLISHVTKGAYSELPQRITVIGVWECVPLTSGLPDSECVPGVARDQSDAHFVVDTMLMSSILTAKVGDRVRVEGVMTPANQLSTDHWQKYPIDGIISATVVEKL